MPIKGPLIYMLTFPSDRRYIGQTSRTYEERMKSHKNSINSSHGCRLVKAAIKKYGWDSVIKEVLVLCDKDSLDSYETKFIDIYNTLAPNGYNLETGGHGNKVISTSSRKLMSDAQKKRDNRVFRKSAETKDLPKFIGKVNQQYSKGYKISRHPSCPYKNFCNKNKSDAENLQEAKEFLDKLDTNEVTVVARPKKTLPVGILAVKGGFRVELRDPVHGRYTKMFNHGSYTIEEQYKMALVHMIQIKLSRIRYEVNQIITKTESLMTFNKKQIDILRTKFND